MITWIVVAYFSPSSLDLPCVFTFWAGILASLNLVIVPLLTVFCLLLPFLGYLVPDSDSNITCSKSHIAAEDGPYKSCKDNLGRYDRCQTSEFAVVVDGAEIIRESKEVNVERGAIGNPDTRTLVENGVQVLPECNKVGNIGCMIGCRYWVVRLPPHAITPILHSVD